MPSRVKPLLWSIQMSMSKLSKPLLSTVSIPWQMSVRSWANESRTCSGLVNSNPTSAGATSSSIDGPLTEGSPCDPSGSDPETKTRGLKNASTARTAATPIQIPVRVVLV